MTPERLARYVSILTSPFIVIPIVGMIVVFAVSSGLRDAVQWGSMLLLIGIAPTVLYITYGVKRGWITDMHIRLRNERLMPFVIAIVSIAVLTVSYRLLGAPHLLVAMIDTMIILGIVLALVTLFWKASIHAGVWLGSTVFLVITVGRLWAVIAFVTPLIIWARHYRHRHTYWQGIIGAVLSAGVVALSLLLFGVYI